MFMGLEILISLSIIIIICVILIIWGMLKWLLGISPGERPGAP